MYLPVFHHYLIHSEETLGNLMAGFPLLGSVRCHYKAVVRLYLHLWSQADDCSGWLVSAAEPQAKVKAVTVAYIHSYTVYVRTLFCTLKKYFNEKYCRGKLPGIFLVDCEEKFMKYIFNLPDSLRLKRNIYVSKAYNKFIPQKNITNNNK